MESLEKLLLSGCCKLEKFPEIAGSMDCLRGICLYGTAIKALPMSIELLSGLEDFTLKHCKNLSFNNLESISFGDCKYLIKTPDFTFAPNLKEVILEGCKMLGEIHPSLLVHKKITYLYMTFCTSLTTLPNQMHMESLERLVLSFCYKLEKFPEIVGSMDCLYSICLNNTAIKGLPMSIELLRGLKYFELNYCKNLVSLPVTINGLKSLTNFDLSGCSKLDNLPETLGQVEKLSTLDVGGTAIRRPMASIFLMKNLVCLKFRGCKRPLATSLSSLFLKTFRLPTLSGFGRSLYRLVMSDCNMEEGAIPNDFFYSFPSLRFLGLRKNNFVSLPGSINSLSKLRYLYLDGCKRLQSLPELPSKIRHIKVDGCVALETTSNTLRLCNSTLSTFSCVNCLKLICYNNQASSMPREFLKAMSKPTNRPWWHCQWINEFQMVIPGSEIPEWFQHQSETSSIKIERPPDSCDNKMVGYAVCCVFYVHEHQLTPSKGYYIGSHGIGCELTNIDPLNEPWIQFENNLGKAVLDHLWLFYFCASALNQDFVELSFKLRGPGLKVKKCGIHPIYEKEIEELKPRAKKCSSSSFWNSYELDEDFLGSTADVDCDGAEDADDIYFSAHDED
ncbi:TMV resistance protein N-like [Pistacia vera]|uniref:TMV resistance protein N-like n=1 Tax=Pistacia vera TaxID=55513 RepID=UPI001263B9DC|nr:TMV resistance protein N-like [Pistacia vera]